MSNVLTCLNICIASHVLTEVNQRFKFISDLIKSNEGHSIFLNTMQKDRNCRLLFSIAIQALVLHIHSEVKADKLS